MGLVDKTILRKSNGIHDHPKVADVRHGHPKGVDLVDMTILRQPIGRHNHPKRVDLVHVMTIPGSDFEKNTVEPR